MSAAMPEEPMAGDDHVVGERGIASVNEARSLQSRVSNVLAMGLMSTLGVGLLGWYYLHTFSHQTEVRKQAQAASRNQASSEMALPSLGTIDPPAPANPPAAAPILGPPPALPQGMTMPVADVSNPGTAPPAIATAAPQKPPWMLALERRLGGPVSAGPGVPKDTAGAASSESPAAAAAASGTSVAPAGESPLASILRPTATPATRAEVLPAQRLLLPKGAFIDCTLETAMDSTLPGMTTCITATDTFGVDGSTVLIERGSKLVGETRGQVAQGQSRLFVLWTEVRTPTGVIVPLDSPGTDELGRSGLSGEVNRHFFQRFGAAILISVISGAVQAATTHDGGGTVIYNPSTTTDVLTEVLRSTVNIPPTITKNQGDRIQVFVARDLDFRSVYELKTAAR